MYRCEGILYDNIENCIETIRNNSNKDNLFRKKNIVSKINNKTFVNIDFYKPFLNYENEHYCILQS